MNLEDAENMKAKEDKEAPLISLRSFALTPVLW